MHRLLKNRYLQTFIVLVMVGGLVAGLRLVQQQQELREKAATLSVTVSPGTFSLSGNGSSGWVGQLKNSNNYATNITVPQDTGYFVKFANGSTTSGAVQVSIKKSDGTWTAWGPFKNGSQQIYANNSIAVVDFSEWPPTPIGTYEAKFRINSSDNPNSIVVKVTAFDSAGYFPFNSGNYYLLKNFSSGYWTRVDVEEQTNFSVTWNSKSKSITANPLRFSMSSNNPWVDESTGKYDFRWFLSSGFDSWGIGNSKWAFQSVFYSRSGSPSLKMSGSHQFIFFPKNSINPAYFVAKKTMDMISIFDKYPMDSIKVRYPFYGGTLNSSQVQLVYNNVGWRTAQRVMKVQHPKYSGPVLRIRFWEYDSGNGTLSYLNSTSVNNDDWYFVKGLGLIGIDSQTIRGSKCSSNPTCADQTVTMSNPQASLRVDDIANYANGESVNLQVGRNGSFSSLYAIVPGDSYQIKVYKKDGKPYNGFLEVLINSNRQVFKDINQNPVWVTNGIGTIQTGVNQQIGDYVFSVRPYIYSDLIYTQSKELSSSNRLSWSNSATIRLQISPNDPDDKPLPTNTSTPTPTRTPTPTKKPTNTPTRTPTPKPTATNTPRPTATNTPKPTGTNVPTNTPIPLVSDLNGDGHVNISDYTILIQNFGSTSCGNTADINKDCKVNIFDYNLLLIDYGK